jgi:hypothetical protein
MSSIVIAGDTSGTITLSAPAVAGSNTISLPAVTGTILTTAYTGAVTFDGDFTVDTNTLHVDSTNNRVGIGKTNPTTALDVVGTVTATTFAGALTGNVTGDVSGNAGTVTNGVYTTDIGSTVQAYDADLTTLAGLSSADGNFIVGSATGWVVESGATARTSLGLGTAATTASTDYATAAQGSTADSALQPGDIGSTVQAYDADTTKNDVANTFTANQTINADLTVDTNTLYVDSTNNRVGIGTSSPNSKFSIDYSSSSTSAFATYDNIPILLKNTSNTDNNWSIIACQDASGDFASYIGTQYTSQVSNTAVLTFGTNPGSGATERMRIDSSGNVGIGTSSPSARLHVHAPSSSDLITKLEAVTAGYASNLQLLGADASGSRWNNIRSMYGSTEQWYIGGNGSDATIAFRTGSGATERMRITSTGNVGIGTTSPTEGKLVVRNDSGDAKLNIKVNSFAGTNGVAALDFSTGGQGANEPQARIHALGANNYSADIIFSTQQSGTTNPLVERMRIDSNGNVGISTTSPSYMLSIGSGTTSVAETAVLFLQSGNGGGGSRDFSIEGDGSSALLFKDRGFNNGNNGTGEIMRLDFSGNLKFNSGYGSVATAYGCRAWVNFNGTGTVAIRDSGNVSSITDSGVGDYRVNFSTAMPDTDYSVVGSCQGVSGSDIVDFGSFGYGGSPTITPTTSQVAIGAFHYNGGSVDTAIVSVAVFR